MDISQYTKFFNYGYFLSKYEPLFLKKLLNATEGQDEINEPLTAGKAQYNKERVLNKLRSVSKRQVKTNLKIKELSLKNNFCSKFKIPSTRY